MIPTDVPMTAAEIAHVICGGDIIAGRARRKTCEKNARYAMRQAEKYKMTRIVGTRTRHGKTSALVWEVIGRDA